MVHFNLFITFLSILWQQTFCSKPLAAELRGKESVLAAELKSFIQSLRRLLAIDCGAQLIEGVQGNPATGMGASVTGTNLGQQTFGSKPLAANLWQQTFGSRT